MNLSQAKKCLQASTQIRRGFRAIRENLIDEEFSIMGDSSAYFTRWFAEVMIGVPQLHEDDDDIVDERYKCNELVRYFKSEVNRLEKNNND